MERPMCILSHTYPYSELKALGAPAAAVLKSYTQGEGSRVLPNRVHFINNIVNPNPLCHNSFSWVVRNRRKKTIQTESAH